MIRVALGIAAIMVAIPAPLMGSETDCWNAVTCGMSLEEKREMHAAISDAYDAGRDSTLPDTEPPPEDEHYLEMHDGVLWARVASATGYHHSCDKGNPRILVEDCEGYLSDIPEDFCLDVLRMK